MKKFLIAAIVSFGMGIAVFNIIPVQKTIIVSGDVPLLNKRELINNSSVIVRGTIEKLLPSKWSNPNLEKGLERRNIIQTDVVVSIQDVYKNIPYDNEIIVRINNGEVGNTKLISEGYPSFIPGEEVVLFLSRDDGDLANPSEEYYVLTGMLQGKFSLVGDGDKSAKLFKNSNDIDWAIEKATFNPSTIKQDIETTREMTKEQIRINNEMIFGEYSKQ